ncbi:hypothetical protein ACFL1H_06675, partial [Nanoarchaeota archaeon]
MNSKIKIPDNYQLMEIIHHVGSDNVKVQDVLERIYDSVHEYIINSHEVKPEPGFFSDGNFLHSMEPRGQIPALFGALKYCNEESKILYVASSYGLGMKLIEEAGFNVKGIDFDENAVDFCKSQGLDVVNEGLCNFISSE